MDQDQEGSRDGGQRTLQRLLGYLARERIPQNVAEAKIRAGFRHCISENPPYPLPRVTALKQLAKALGYKSHTSMYPAKGRLPSDAEYMIQQLYGIAPTSECWKHFCNNDYAKFTAEYEKTHPIAEGTPREPTQPAAAPNRATLVPLQWDAWADEPPIGTPYAYVTLRTGNSPIDAAPGQIHLGFDLNCPLVLADKVETGLKRCLLIFDCGDGHTGPLSTRTGNAGGVAFEGAHFCTYGTDVRKPSWLVTATGDGVIGKVETVPATFICIDLLRPGSAVKAWIRANVKEIRTHFVVPDDKPRLSEAKRKIKERVKLLEHVDGEDGDVVFAKSEIKLMARDGAAKPDPKG